MASIPHDMVYGQPESMDLDEIFDFNAFTTTGASPRLLPITDEDFPIDTSPDNGDIQIGGFGLGIGEPQMMIDGPQFSQLDFAQPVRQAITSSVLLGGLSTAFLLPGGIRQDSVVLDAPLSPTGQPTQSSFAFEPRGAPLVRGRLPERARKILNEWFHSNEHYPYPSEHEESSLVQSTGLSLKQVKTYFVNARARFKKTSE